MNPLIRVLKIANQDKNQHYLLFMRLWIKISWLLSHPIRIGRSIGMSLIKN